MLIYDMPRTIVRLPESDTLPVNAGKDLAVSEL